MSPRRSGFTNVGKGTTRTCDVCGAEVEVEVVHHVCLGPHYRERTGRHQYGRKPVRKEGPVGSLGKGWLG